MADFSKLIITDKGKELLNSEMLLEGPLEFTKIAVSSREYEEEEISSLEELTDIRQEKPVRKVTVERGAVTVDFMLSNEELAEGYFIRSIGLFARQGDGEEILFAAAVEKSGGSYMPEHSETVTSLQMKLRFRIDNVQNVKIVVDAGGTATMGDVLEVRDMVLEEAERAGAAEEQLKKQTETETERASKKEADLEEKKLDKDGDASDSVVNFVPAESLEQLQSGKEQKVLYGQLAKAVTELIAHLANKLDPHDTTKEQVGLGNADNTSDMAKPVSVAQQAALDALYEQLTAYTLQKIADLINGAPSTLDTLGEIAQAMQANEDVVAALDEAIGKKANAAEFDSHIKDKSNPHKVKATQAEAVSFSESQELSETQKATARDNIGAGTSSFSGKYADLSGKPAIPDISGKVNKSGDIITGQLKREPVDYFYLYGRDGAMIRQNGREGTYDPILSSKTVNGSWDMGAKNDIMHLFFISDEEYEKGINGSAAADIVFRSDGTIGATADNADMLDGKHASDFIGADGYVDRVGKNGFIVYPKSGYLNLQNQSSISGYLRVILPQWNVNTMLKFTVSIYNYQENTSVDYIISGYLYKQEMRWYSKTAVCVGQIGGRLANLPVGFGVYESKFAVEIGYSTTEWNHPVVVIHDIVVGHANKEYCAWSEDWDLYIDPNGMAVSAHGGVIENPNVAFQAGNADTVDGVHADKAQSINTLVCRDHNGYTFLNYINSSTNPNENPAIGQFIVENTDGDGFYRKASLEHVKSQLGVPTFSLSGTTLTIYL